ncbi:Rv1355c family protein [Mycolicibacterium goodii]|uniref:Rv1355c family protein n=1 Tax=Mycolicibacterium goodii TaxID=134601 RepID=UPI001BDD8393|nr:Rv1355c family protein [Mycolicibacterium goodii]MBU8807998.1 Rv1355c family protein [Mycolicibacterium goodii]
MQTAYTAQVLDPTLPGDKALLDELRAAPGIEFLDHHDGQLESLRALRPAPADELLREGRRWAYYPWRRAVVAVLGPRGFQALRLDRNRNNITAAEQDELGTLTIGVAGLSVGHVIAHTLAAQGLCGKLRLADFDKLELSNLNRVPATVFDLGVNKAVVAARRIAEIDPYLDVEVVDAGLNAETLDDFVDGLDIVVEECDSLDIKALLRVAARDRHIPVLMATSDRGIVDVERFDQEPARPILHGLLGQLDIGLLPGMSSREKIPHVLRHLEAERLSPRTAASLIEIDRSLSTWPQLASDVIIGASAIAEAVRRIGLGEELGSGRSRVDVNWALGQIREPDMAHRYETTLDDPDTPQALDGGPLEHLATAAMRAPSGGNTQPWQITIAEDSITVSLDPEHTSTMDVKFRGSAVALGAALLNIKIAAAELRVLGPVTVTTGEAVPLRATMRTTDDGTDPALASFYQSMLARESNRHHGTPKPLDNATIAQISDAAEQHGGHLHLLTQRDQISQAAAILAAADRIRFLTPRLHEEMISELRWPGDPDPDTGIDVRSLEFDAGEMAVLDVLRRPDVMAHLAEWDAGSALGDDMRDRVLASSALAVVTVTGNDLLAYAAGGSAVEAVWIAAQQQGFGVQPVSPVFLYAHTAAELEELSAPFASELGRLQSEFNALAQLQPGESVALILRLTVAPPASLPSRRSISRVRGSTTATTHPLSKGVTSEPA